MYADSAKSATRPAITVPKLRQMKAEGQRIVALTAYDASFARLLDGAGVDLILVGDSLGMVVQGMGAPCR
jgi:3-methyl-2-oxobutanoate hydroxymethyltransferase